MINIIAAITHPAGVLGKDNKLLWHIPEDLKRFKALTTGHPIIMGRKTFESIGRPLPNRTNMVISRSKNIAIPEIITCASLEEAIVEAKKIDDEIFIIGGGQIYEQALPLADKLYLTLVHAEFEGDTFFPDYSMFSKKISEQKKEAQPYSYTFLELIKQKTS